MQTHKNSRAFRKATGTGLFRGSILYSRLVFAGLLLAASVCYPLIHNDDRAHTTHPLEHSAVCKWVKDGKICRTGGHAGLRLVLAAFSLVLLPFLLPCRGVVHKRPGVFSTLLLPPVKRSRAPPRVCFP